MDELKIYDVKEVAKLLKVTTSTVKRYINSKRLKAFKVGNSWRITKSDILDFIENNKR